MLERISTWWQWVQDFASPLLFALVGVTIVLGQRRAFDITQIGSIQLVGTNNFSVKTGVSGARMEMDSKVIKVYYANGVLRVKLGYLSA